MGLLLHARSLAALVPARDEGTPFGRKSRGARRLRSHRRLHLPVLVRLERADLALAVHDQAKRDALHASRTEASGHLAPEHGAHHVAHDAVKDSPRLLRVDAVGVDGARLAERLEDRGARDLVELDALGLGWLHPEQLRQVPCDRLAFPVKVGGEPDLAGLLREALEVVDLRLAVVADDVLGLEPMVEVHPRHRLLDALGRSLGQIAYVPLRGLDAVARPEVLADRLRLRGALDDHEAVVAGCAVVLVVCGRAAGSAS